ncbi:undecaprenyldiphospho-muramoylpentapeptide beta-N-acetylglucosaminyltransferase [uncultured Nitratireductor sp.]|uniref:undecaprenyldiphospho-muramoylpentapeptide beta-N-acetylglucosaminyltransferase n=1 Tax=uncultured Nitratireductor sp. TaxID=520953 RepID=UPI0025D46DEB|nr:undecaprenyldiphospho-muramoylpentapeptide beta-N-acetylglucosaminyltransferase [uncultured Nitratireductor sp.]
MTKGIILLAAGGTGGHLFPAEALAHALHACGWSVHLATDKRAARFAGTFPAEETHIIESATFGSKNPIALLKAGWTIWRGVKQASALLQRLRPAAVVGFGGYPTLPPLWAATRRDIPALIHEQNAVMGRANKALAGRVQAIAGGFLPDEGPFADKIVATGNPVRPAVIEASAASYRAAEAGETFRLLVFGGSQGAQFFSDAMPAALAKLAPQQRERLVVTQQARPEDEADVRAAYDKLGVTADIATFFTDMARRMAESHLIVSRSGASTVSEIAAIGRPAILVPYPHALDHDQAANAAALERAGGAELHAQSTLSSDRLSELISAAMNDPQRLAGMAVAARSVGKPNAAELLVGLVEAIASGQPAKTLKEGTHA